MSKYKPCNIDLLAKAIYRKQSDYVGADHAGYCVAELKIVLQSFETKIVKDADALEQAQAENQKLQAVYELVSTHSHACSGRDCIGYRLPLDSATLHRCNYCNAMREAMGIA